MSLKTLVDELNKTDPAVLRNKGTEIAAGRVVYPADFGSQETQVHQAVWRESKGHNLRLSAYIDRSIGETLPLLNSLMEKSRRMQFEPHTFELESQVMWTDESFQTEVELGDLKRLQVRASFHSADPTKVRIGFPGTTHKLEAEYENGILKISATGDYSSLLPVLIERIKPQFATIRLSQADANRWLKKVKWPRKWFLERVLRPQRKNFMVFRMGGGVTFDEKEIIEATVRAFLLPACSEAIGKPLINQVKGETSFLVSLSKVISRKSYLLSTLKTIVQVLEQLRSDTLFEHTLHTPATAKVMLGKEIDLVCRSYESLFAFGMNTHMVRGPLTKRLAREHFGADVLGPFDEMTPGGYLEFLKGRGFEYNGELEDKLKIEPGYIQKEQYLLQYFKQSYARDPMGSIEKFRQYYANSKPEVSITAKFAKDASVLSKLTLPTKAVLIGVSLKERSKKGDNEMVIDRLTPDSKVHFWLRASLGSCRLLDIQEDLCKEVGVVCY